MGSGRPRARPGGTDRGAQAHAQWNELFEAGRPPIRQRSRPIGPSARWELPRRLEQAMPVFGPAKAMATRKARVE